MPGEELPQEKTADDHLAACIENAKSARDDVAGWYIKKIPSKRWTSYGIRIIAFLLLAAGTVLPLYSVLTNNEVDALRKTQLGIICLAVAGLVQLFDKLFGISSSWLRYTKARIEIEKRFAQFEFEITEKVLMTDKPDDNDVKATMNLMVEDCKRDFKDLELKETEGWITEFDANLQALDHAINSQRTKSEATLNAMRKDLEARQAKVEEKANALIPGSASLIIDYGNFEDEVNIAFNKVIIQTKTRAKKLSLGTMPAGLYEYSVTSHASGKLLLSDVISIKAGQKSEEKTPALL